MSEKYISGTISFIHHEKNRAVIEYIENGKKRNIQGDIDEREQRKLVDQKLIKKPHRFLVGDQVKFQIKKTGGNGRIIYAQNVQYQFNTGLELLINQALVNNKFLGYIKITDHKYFIKEIESYLFFPMKVSAYEIPPTAEEIERPVTFKLENIDKPDKIFATLYNHHYIPEFLEAIQHFKKQLPVIASVSKISPFAIYLTFMNGKMEAKLNIDEKIAAAIADNSLQQGSEMNLLIKHLTPEKVIVERI